MSFRDDRRAAEERIRILEQEMDRLRDAEQRADALATDLGETRAALEARERDLRDGWALHLRPRRGGALDGRSKTMTHHDSARRFGTTWSSGRAEGG